MSDDDSFDDLLPWQSRQRVWDPICDGDTDDELDLNEEQSGDCMSTASASSVEEEDDQGSPVDTGDGDSRKRKADEITNISVIDTEEVDAELPATERADMGTNTKPRPGRAIIDHLAVGGKICLSCRLTWKWEENIVGHCLSPVSW